MPADIPLSPPRGEMPQAEGGGHPARTRRRSLVTRRIRVSHRQHYTRPEIMLSALPARNQAICASV